MRLTFLGQPYETHTPAIAPMESELTGQYRGNRVQFSQAQTTPRANVTLSYRGIRYTR